MTDTSTTATDPVVEQPSASEPQDNANAADLHIESRDAELQPEPEPEEPEAATETAEETTETAEEPEAKPKKKEDWRDRRFKQENAKRHAAETRAAELEARIAALENPEGAEQPAENRSNLTEGEIERRAAQIVEQRAYQNAINTTVSEGEKEFGKVEFTEACNLLAEMGATEKPEFLQVVTDTDNGHKVLQHLGENPEEAERILALPALKMAAAIARISVDLGKPKAAAPISKAPTPIKPIDGRARVEPAPDKMNDDEFTEKYFKPAMQKIRSR